jgi:predicted metalloprotease with PDZ domain
MIKKFMLLIGLQCCVLLALAQSVSYQFAAPNAVHHEAIITMTVKDLPLDNTLFRMSRSSPGRYATHEFGKNVYKVSAADAQGKPLRVIKVEGDVYAVPEHKGFVQLSYTLFANYADGTYASVDVAGYHLNMPATFMWVVDLEKSPITLSFKDLPAGWSVATQLYPTEKSNVFTAPHQQYFMDAPVKAGPLRYREWQVTNTNGKPLNLRIAFDTEATDQQLDAFTDKVKKIAAEIATIFGEYPDFETGRYTFLASLNPYVQGDGMEHRNSTMISLPVAPAMMDFALGTFSHEFFHAWNVERIRPQTLEPFSFEHSNMSDGLWVAEGFTQYYGDLAELRSGLGSESQWLSSLAGLINTKQHRPGGSLFNVIENSQYAVFTDAGVSVDKTNFENTFSSYYTTGAATALALDLELRTRFNKTLDDYMRLLWQRHGKTEKPYSINDLQDVLAETTGDAKHAADFFALYVHKSQPYNYAKGLYAMGLQVVPRDAGKAWAGPWRLEERGGKTIIANATRKGTPLYEAGIDAGDELVSVDGQKIRNSSDFSNWLAGKKPGDKASLVIRHRGKEATIEMTLKESPDIVIQQLAGATEAQLAKRKAWLQSQQRP